ncbi:MAG: sulfur carrier protein ThiS [Frankia sp.]|nr:sulfur carrier protein ThiS [Frankia sp.]
MVDATDAVPPAGQQDPAAVAVGRPAPGCPWPTVSIVVNGRERQVPAGQPLPELIADLGLRVGSVVVEYNGEALTQAEAREVRLGPGDRLELVRAVAGG